MGTAEGSTILRTWVRGASLSTRLTFCRSGSMVATPTVVLMRVGQERLHRLTVKAEMTKLLAKRIRAHIEGTDHHGHQQRKPGQGRDGF